MRGRETTQCGGSMGVYLATSLAAVLIRVGFIKRIGWLVPLEVFLEELKAGLLCNVGGHGVKESVGRVRRLPVCLYSLGTSPHPAAAEPQVNEAGSEPKRCHGWTACRPDVTLAIGSRARVTIGGKIFGF